MLVVLRCVNFGCHFFISIPTCIFNDKIMNTEDYCNISNMIILLICTVIIL